VTYDDHAHSKQLTILGGVLVAWSLIEYWIGHITTSLSIKADAVHCVTDAIGILMSALAYRIGQEKGRLREGAAYFNIALTVLACGHIVYEAFNPSDKNGLYLAAAFTAWVSIGINHFVLKKLALIDDGSSCMHATKVHALGDLWISIFALIGIILTATGIIWLDKVIGVAIALYLLIGCVKVLYHIKVEHKHQH